MINNISNTFIPVAPVKTVYTKKGKKKTSPGWGLKALVMFLRFWLVILIFTWPLVRWIVAFDVVFRFGKMVYFWNHPGVHAGLEFLLHFGVLTVLTYLTSTPELLGKQQIIT